MHLCKIWLQLMQKTTAECTSAKMQMSLHPSNTIHAEQMAAMQNYLVHSHLPIIFTERVKLLWQLEQSVSDGVEDSISNNLRQLRVCDINAG